jgi:hypothetical protein
MPAGINLELLAEREFDERLVLATSEQREEAAEDRQGKNGQRPHTSMILGRVEGAPEA